MEYVKPSDTFSIDEPNTPQRWARWEKQFGTYFVAAELGDKSGEVQVARLLNAAGSEAQEVHDLFVFANEDEKKDYKVILKKFGEYCRPKKNVVYERHKFWSRRQNEGEPFDKWLKEMRVIAKDCEFAEEDNMIRDKIVYGVFDKKVQERMLRKSDLTLKDATDMCRAAESSQSQLADIRKQEQLSVNEVSASALSPVEENPNNCPLCKRPGHSFHDCPSRKTTRSEVQCYSCKGFGHMSRVCPSERRTTSPVAQRGRGKRRNRDRGRGRGGGAARELHEVDEQQMDTYAQEFSSLSLHVLRVSSLSDASRKRFVKFRFHNLLKKTSRVEGLKVDSGAEANVIPLRWYRKLFPGRVDAQGKPIMRFVRKSTRRLEAYGGVQVPHFGTVLLPCQYNGTKFMCQFYLCDIEGSMLLGLPTCEALGIVEINIVDEEDDDTQIDGVCCEETGKSRHYVDSTTPIEDRPPINSKEDLLRMYPECFKHEGRYFKNFQYEIKVDPSAQPKARPARRVPFEVRPKLKAKLEEMEKRGIIKKVEEPTQWVNSLVVETKPNGDLRVCLDPSDLNKAIVREYHPIPVIDDIVPELKDSDLFTKLDLKDGYWHIRLTEESSFLTTFATPFGRYRYDRLPFGLCVSQDIFQFKVDETYGGCEGTIGISDDITCHGKGDRQHDRRLHGAMERTRRANLCLNYEKLIVKQSAVKFFGNVYSADGVQADPEKVAAIASMRPPKTKGEVKSFLGMVNYLQQFLPRLSEQTKVLRDLEKKGTHFSWGSDHQACFDNIKSLVSDSLSLAYYDRSKPVTLQTDYSENGIGVALVQDGKPVRFASKSLSERESEYAPIEGEMLGVVYGIKKFHHYLYGRRFVVECDHKPLHHIHRKNLSLAPPRLRGMLRSVADYDFSIQHRPGKEMVLPDVLSRLSGVDKVEVQGTRVRVDQLVDISPSRLQRLQQETDNDETLVKLKEMVRKGWPRSCKSVEPALKPYWGVHDDMSVVDGLLLAGSRIIIPQASRNQVLQEIHQGHQGVTKCTLRAKSAVYWPGMYKQIQSVVGNCGACREFENAQAKCPMIPVDVPSQPWHTVGADLFHHKGTWFLLVTDAYSKAPFVRHVGNTGAYASIKAMKSIFAENGIPVRVISDNGKHFIAAGFRQFAASWGFELVLSSPEYPKGHALIERHIQTVKKCMDKCDISGFDFDLALLVLRSTPLGPDLPSPAELLQQRRFRTTLPTHVPDPPSSAEVKSRLQERQRAAAERYDTSAKEKSDLVPGQHVRLFNKAGRWEPAVVTGSGGTPRSYVVQRLGGGVPLRRNRVHLRSTAETFEDVPQCVSEEDDEDEDALPVDSGEPSGTPQAAPTASPPVAVPDAPGLRRGCRTRKQTQFFQAGM